MVSDLDLRVHQFQGHLQERVSCLSPGAGQTPVSENNKAALDFNLGTN